MLCGCYYIQLKDHAQHALYDLIVYLRDLINTIKVRWVTDHVEN